jgi:hypothetical protein
VALQEAEKALEACKSWITDKVCKTSLVELTARFTSVTDCGSVDEAAAAAAKARMATCNSRCLVCNCKVRSRGGGMLTRVLTSVTSALAG